MSKFFEGQYVRIFLRPHSAWSNRLWVVTFVHNGERYINVRNFYHPNITQQRVSFDEAETVINLMCQRWETVRDYIMKNSKDHDAHLGVFWPLTEMLLDAYKKSQPELDRLSERVKLLEIQLSDARRAINTGREDAREREEMWENILAVQTEGVLSLGFKTKGVLDDCLCHSERLHTIVRDAIEKALKPAFCRICDGSGQGWEGDGQCEECGGNGIVWENDRIVWQPEPVTPIQRIEKHLATTPIVADAIAQVMDDAVARSLETSNCEYGIAIVRKSSSLAFYESSMGACLQRVINEENDRNPVTVAWAIAHKGKVIRVWAKDETT